MVNRIYTEKRIKFALKSTELKKELTEELQIKNIDHIRIFQRYDVEGIEDNIFKTLINTVFSEPSVDLTYKHLPQTDAKIFAVEYLPGQFDQRADSCEQCIELITEGIRPIVKTAIIYLIFGNISDNEFKKIKSYVINPVESREASLERFETLKCNYEIPTTVKTLEGFNDLSKNELSEFLSKYSLAMDIADLSLCQKYFISENRNPTITEIKMLDTYWSDHCRHTTFLTSFDNIEIKDDSIKKVYSDYLNIRKSLGVKKPITLMDMATIGAKYLKSTGALKNLDESDEINACTVKIKVDVDGKDEDWLFLFKNETHNHPTEIEPFGGAATCIGGAIRDPLSGRAYVYQAMRITGASNPLAKISDTLKGKLPQRKIVTTAANGYSSYGNQIGLATGEVKEIYHDGYVAKRMEIGAVVGAVPAKNVRREEPSPSDIVILLGGRTGRDGIGGATGSSKSHNVKSIEKDGAEVQKGNATEERKLQRLFRNSAATSLIKRCNDFGAGGVSVAIGELADGLDIYLDNVKRKYDGLDGTELAISESQERMAVVVAKKDENKFLSFAAEENLEATVVAEITDKNRLRMFWNNKIIVDISRDFLNSNGAEKHTNAVINMFSLPEKKCGSDFIKNYLNLASNINVCSQRGLSERFDSTIGAGTILMPFGGKYQITPPMSMVAKIPVLSGTTETVSFMSWGFNPFITEKNIFLGSYLAVVESILKIIASGGDFSNTYLTFQEYFEKMSEKADIWGKPVAALLGALKAQLDLKIASIGGKDSMSGSFENINVPPTLVSFAVSTGKLKNVVSPEFKMVDSNVYLLKTQIEQDGTFNKIELLKNIEMIEKLIKDNKVLSVSVPSFGGIAESVMKACFGNKIGFKYNSDITVNEIFKYNYGTFIIETNEKLNLMLLGKTVSNKTINYREKSIFLNDLLKPYENNLETVFPTKTKDKFNKPSEFIYKNTSKFFAKINISKPKVIIPVFPGSNCEYDSMRAFEKAGAETDVFIIKNLNQKAIKESVEEFAKRLSKTNIMFIPGGFSLGDEPDGSGKFITAYLRNKNISNEINTLIKNKDGLILGICNGFQALIKLGLVPFGEITEQTEESPTLTFNTIGRHQSRLVNTKIFSDKSPFLYGTSFDEIYSVPISHGEGRFVCSQKLFEKLKENGQIATRYVDDTGFPTMNIDFNPNGSFEAVEGITSPDGRIFGKMGHSERFSNGTYKNVCGNRNMKIFENAVNFYKI